MQVNTIRKTLDAKVHQLQQRVEAVEHLLVTHVVTIDEFQVKNEAEVHIC